MVTIRLTRRGARNQPFYHVVVTDSRKRQGGKSLEMVGFFNPVARRNDTKLRLDLPRIDFRVTCTKGTYVRTICHDIGEALGVWSWRWRWRWRAWRASCEFIHRPARSAA